MAVDTLARTIAAAKARGGGGSGLPAVTSDDNGDVLTVVSGQWDKAWPNNNYVCQVYAEEDQEDPGTFWCDLPAINMYDAFHTNGVLINDDLVVNATSVYDDVSGESQYTFTVLVINSGTVSAITYTADSDGDSPHYTA